MNNFNNFQSKLQLFWSATWLDWVNLKRIWGKTPSVRSCNSYERWNNFNTGLLHLLFFKLKAFLGMKMYTFISRIHVKYNLKCDYSVIVNVFNQFSLQNWVAFTRRISCLSWNFTFTSFVFSIMKVLLWKIAFTLQILVKSFSLSWNVIGVSDLKTRLDYSYQGVS